MRERNACSSSGEGGEGAGKATREDEVSSCEGEEGTEEVTREGVREGP